VSQQINLLNPAFQKRRAQFSAATMALSIVIVAFASAIVYAYAEREAGRLERLAAESDAQLKLQRERLVSLGTELSDRGRGKLLEEELAALQLQLKRREELHASMLKAGGEAGGFSQYLAALARRTANGVWLTGIAIGGTADAIVIKGRGLESELIPAYIGTLHREAPFAGRSVSELRVESRSVEDKAAVKPGAPAAAAGREPPRYVEFTITIPAAAAAGGGAS